MITICLLVIGFFTGGTTFGGQIISAFGLAQYWLWFVAVLGTFISIIVFGAFVYGGSAIGHDTFGKFGALLTISAASLLGALISILMVGGIYLRLWLSYYIVQNTLPEAQTWNDLQNNTQIAISLFFILWVIDLLYGVNRKNNEK